MGQHRAERRGLRRRTAGPVSSAAASQGAYVGRRVAGREAAAAVTTTPPEATVAPLVRVAPTVEPDVVELPAARVRPTPPVPAPVPSTATTVVPTVRAVVPLHVPAPSVELPAPSPVTDSSAWPAPLVDLALLEAETSEVPAIRDLGDTTAELPRVTPGRRRAVKPAAPSRGPLFSSLRSPSVLLGVAALAIAVGGVVTTYETPTAPVAASQGPSPATALTGNGGTGVVGARGQDLSRGSDGRSSTAAATTLEQAAEEDAEVRSEALGELAQQAEQQAKKLESDRWVLPLSPSIITATFGQYGLWSSYHTGLDFNGNTGDPISAIAAGTVTSTGYDGAYGNKTVVTLEDGTELWYCHQTSIYVSPGETVAPGETIGTVGTTGNVTGSHLHVEVRPGGGDPVDPYAAFVQHGVTP